MCTYAQILYQIVFGTTHLERTMVNKDRPELLKYITGLLKKKNCHLCQINGVENHLHIITELYPSTALASLVKDIKLSTTTLIREQIYFRILVAGKMAMQLLLITLMPHII